MVKKPSDEAPEPITDDAVPTSSDNGVSEANTLNVDQSNVVNMDNTNPIATPVKKQQQAALPKTVAQTPTQSKIQFLQLHILTFVKYLGKFLITFHIMLISGNIFNLQVRV